MSQVRHAIRQLRRSPGFAAAAILTLALGIGANTALFSVVQALLLSPLPFRDPSQLVFVWCDLSSGGYPRAPLSAPELQDLRDRTTHFSGFGAIWATSGALTGEGDPEQLRMGLVTSNFFSLLGTEAALGRTFVPDDETQNGAPKAILIAASVWRGRYGSDPGIVGRRVELNGQPVTVVGVMPDDFRLWMPPDASVPDDLQAWVPLNPNLSRAPRGQLYLRVVGRMKPGVTIDEARRDIDGVAAAISREYAAYGTAGRAFTTVPLQADGVRLVRPALLALFAGVAILLAIACVNVAGLLIVRAASRSHETAVRMALGAGLGRLTMQSLADGLVLATAGAVAGIVLGQGMLRALLALRPSTLGRLGIAHVDGTVLAFTALTTLAWGLLVSLAPVAELRRTDVTGALQHEGRRSGGSIHARLRSGLVVLQVALSVVLLVGGSLMVRTFLAARRVDPGFHSEQLLSFKVTLPGRRYPSQEAFNAFARRLQEDLSTSPDVVSLGSISHMPFDDVPNWGGPYITEHGQDESTAPFADNRAVSPGYFETVGARLVAGRLFTEADDQHASPVVIVDDQLAARAWPGQDPIGRQIASDPFSTGHPSLWATVVGVVHHVRHRDLLANLGDQIFFSERQIPRNPMAFVLRGRGDPSSLGPQVRRAVAAIDPVLPVYDVRPMDEYVTGARAAQRFTAMLAATFAAVALALALVGVYGVVSYATARRRYEFGVRLALGAQPREVVGLVVREGVVLAALGVSLGVAGGAVAARAIRSQLYGVSAADPVSYLVAALLIGIVALAACWFPARRAAATSPLTAMRAE